MSNYYKSSFAISDLLIFFNFEKNEGAWINKNSRFIRQTELAD